MKSLFQEKLFLQKAILYSGEFSSLFLKQTSNSLTQIFIFLKNRVLIKTHSQKLGYILKLVTLVYTLDFNASWI